MLANQTMAESELHDALEGIEGSDKAEYFVVVPANPVDTGQADQEGAAFVWEATTGPPRSGSTRPSRSCATRAHGRGRARRLPPAGRAGQGDARVRPDHVVISTQPEERSTWLRHGVVADARERYDVPVQHVVVQGAEPSRVSHGQYRDRAGVGDGLLEHGTAWVRHGEPGIDPTRRGGGASGPGAPARPPCGRRRRPALSAAGEDPFGVPGGSLVGGTGLVVATT